jgi:hypothetical protein
MYKAVVVHLSRGLHCMIYTAKKNTPESESPTLHVVKKKSNCIAHVLFLFYNDTIYKKVIYVYLLQDAFRHYSIRST